MSTDSTELTFVRCPSCRSLVPAVSTRCRMCGAAIDSQGAKQPSEPEAPRRARSNTMTQPDTEFVDTTQAVRAAESSPSAPVSAPPESEFEDFDPLKDYMDDDSDVAVPSSQRVDPLPQISPIPTAMEQINAMEDDIEEDDFDIFASDEDEDESWIDEVEKKKPFQEEKREALKPETVAHVPRIEEKKEEVVPPMNGGTRHDVKPPITKEHQKVIVETGARHGGKPSALSFGKGNQKEETQPKRNQPERNQPADDQQAHKKKAHAFEGQRQQQRPQHNRPEQRGQQEARRDQGGSKPTPPAPQKQPQPQQHQRAEARRDNSEKPRPSLKEGVDSRLSGWLVSFQTPTRSALELREGKFFVTGSSLKPRDLVIEDPSISTPHAMITVEEGRMLVQDLMSETGVYHRSPGKSGFTEIGELFELKHGDSVRFGDVEFLVIMIPIS